MRLIMAVSADGFVARGHDDTMRWLGPHDKAVFKILTSQGNDPTLIRSRRTEMAMPLILPGRRLVTVSRSGLTLKDAAAQHPSAWLIGGQTLAAEAIKGGLISEAYICLSTRFCFDGIPEELEAHCLARGMRVSQETPIGDVKVRQFISYNKG